jgi:hypothetical protein
MRRIHRAASIVLLLAFTSSLAACADGFDPDKLDILGLNEKKKLPGKREALFPEGVPGVTQGIPPEYMKGNIAEQPGAAVPIEPLKPEAQTASAEPAATAEKPKPKPARKHVAAKPKPTRITLKPAPAQAAQPQPGQQATSPWPAAPPPPQQQPAQQASSPWPDQQQQSPAPWPAAPPPGTFTKQ